MSDTTRTFTLGQERKIIVVLGVIQFVNVLDFMMVMPLGPDFASALGIETAKLGWVGGAYTAAASVSGLFASFFLDRFDRKRALLWCMLGLAIATVLGGFATGLGSLLAFRVLAGLFGGPAGSLTFALAADVVPNERRGRAMGALMSSFAISSVLGVPAGLELARLGGWRLPFFAVGGVAFVVLLIGLALLPTMRGHIARAREERSLEGAISLLRRNEVWLAYGCIAAAMVAGFMMIPNMATFFQYNLGFPREKLGLLYLFGGSVSFALMISGGRLIDRFGVILVGGTATAVLIAVSYLGFIPTPSPLPSPLIFIGFMASMGVRGVATSAVASRVPAPHERARFVSFLSVFQNAASAFGAFLSAGLLSAGEDGKLIGVERVAAVSIGFSCFIMIFMVPLERLLDRKDRGRDVA